MMISFENVKDVLNSHPFILEEVRFNLLHRISDDNSSLLMRREDKRVIIAQSGPEFPVWIWTDDSLTEEEQSELTEDFFNLFSDRSKLTIVAKPVIAELLAKDYALKRKIAWRVKVLLEAYHCPKTLIPQNVSGEISKPSIDDIDIIADFFAGFIYDCFNKSTSSDKQIEAAKKHIQHGNLYVLRVSDEIVSMANIAHRSPRHARINQVYTPQQKRKHGYASALVARLSQKIIDEGRVPMLYADLTNPDSNKVYQGIGYIASGKVSEVSFIF